MESGRNKRKMGNEKENCDDDEEGKVEKFFALIRSTREMRDRLRSVSNESKEEEDKKKKKEEEKSVAAAVWNIPAFQVEDFMKMEESKSKNPLVVNDAAAAAGPSSKTEQEAQEKQTSEGGGGEDGSLNLNLSL